MDNSEFVLLEDEHSEYVTTQPGAPYRLFPFGTLYKGGKKRVITREYASTFKLPHFKPPIKLGSHDERTPAGGQIVGLEVRADGLYAVPEFTEQGTTSLEKGDYRYHSPEVIWEGELEDPATGKPITGPLIVGDALLHTPHLGEAAALYSVEINPTKEANSMEEETISVSKTVWEWMTSWLPKKPVETEPQPEPEPAAPQAQEPAAPVIELDKFEALQKERDELKAQADEAAAKLSAIEAEKAHAELLSAITADLAKIVDANGASYLPLGQVEEAAGMMGGMNEEQRAWCLRMFSALAAKVSTSDLYGEKGSDAPGSNDPEQALDAAIKAKMTSAGVDYNAALNMVRAEKPELLTAIFSKGGNS